MITEDYVSFETSKLLKEKGFDENCRAYYKVFPESRIAAIYHSSENRGVSEDDPNEILCPTLQMAMKWLREVHKLHIAILWDCGAYIGKNSFCYHIDRMDNDENKGYNKIGFDSNEEACEAAIKYCLENLI